jgi:hypothetical protein
VPDNDRLPRGIRRFWRRAAEAVIGHQDPTVVGECLERAMAAELRSSAAPLRSLLHALSDASDARRAVEQAVQQAPAAWVHGSGAPFVQAARTAASSHGEPDGDTGFRDVIETGLRRLAWQSCLGPVEPTLGPPDYSSFAEADQFMASCLDEVRFDRLAGAFNRAESGSIIRAPRTRRRKRTTRELLDGAI